MDPLICWRRTAASRLKIELAGIALARKLGAKPEDYARHLWESGAKEWIGLEKPTVAQYFAKEMDAFRLLYPRVVFQVETVSDDYAALLFTSGCLGGWGRNQWELANSLGLSKGLVCRYCRESFRVWSAQLGLDALPRPQADNTCHFEVKLRK